MKNLKVSALVLGALLTLNVGAQNSAPLKLALEAQAAFDKHFSSTGSSLKQPLDMQLALRNLPKSKRNIQTIRGVLASKASNAEKVDALRLLGAMYDESDSFSENSNIAGDLKSHVAHSESNLAAAALYAYTRNVHDDDYLATVRQAKVRGIIGDNEYFGEHAHVLETVRPQVQKLILEELTKSKNKYALQILVATLAVAENGGKYSPETQSALLKTLIDNEPKFPAPIGEFGGFDNYHYENWLVSVARLEEKYGKGDLYSNALKTLSKDGTDPRKILALFSAPFGKNLVRHTKELKQVTTLVVRACEYANSFPTTSSIQNAAKEIESTLSSSYKEFKGMTCANFDN